MPVTGQTTKDELNITYRSRILSFSNNARNKISRCHNLIIWNFCSFNPLFKFYLYTLLIWYTKAQKNPISFKHSFMDMICTNRLLIIFRISHKRYTLQSTHNLQLCKSHLIRIYGFITVKLNYLNQLHSHACIKREYNVEDFPANFDKKKFQGRWKCQLWLQAWSEIIQHSCYFRKCFLSSLRHTQFKRNIH